MRVIVAIVTAFLFALARAHNELLPARGKSCFFEDLRANDVFGVTFQAGTRDSGSSDQPEINFYINDPSGRPVHQTFKATDGMPSVTIQTPGRYEFCFSNEASGSKTTDVTFHTVLHKASERNEATIDTIEGQVKLLGRTMDEVQHEQDYIVIRERVHRNTAESTNDRVKWWSIFQLAVVFSNTVFQVIFLKRFFEVKSHV